MSTDPAGPLPISGGPAEVMQSERASATPTLASPPARPAKAKRRAATPPAPTHAQAAMPLRELQVAFHGIITHPESVGAGLAATRTVPDPLSLFTGADNLSIEDRLGVYHYAYQARLADCLADDFPTVKYALGDVAFAQLCAAVITTRPSRTPNLNFYGRALLEHCREGGSRLRNRAFITQLAELEWAMTEVFHAEALPTFSLEALRAIPLEQWAQMTFTPSPTARILRFTYPVNAYLQAFRRDEHPPIPRATSSATAVYRQGYRIWRMDLTAPMADLLDALFAGTALEPALGAMSSAYPEQPSLDQSVMQWFSEWVKGGFFGVTSPA